MYRVTIDYTNTAELMTVILETVTAVRLLIDASLAIAKIITIEVV